MSKNTLTHVIGWSILAVSIVAMLLISFNEAEAAYPNDVVVAGLGTDHMTITLVGSGCNYASWFFGDGGYRENEFGDYNGCSGVWDWDVDVVEGYSMYPDIAYILEGGIIRFLQTMESTNECFAEDYSYDDCVTYGHEAGSLAEGGYYIDEDGLWQEFVDEPPIPEGNYQYGGTIEEFDLTPDAAWTALVTDEEGVVGGNGGGIEIYRGLIENHASGGNDGDTYKCAQAGNGNAIFDISLTDPEDNTCGGGSGDDYYILLTDGSYNHLSDNYYIRFSYIDGFPVVDLPAVTPTTQFNEVLDYIYDPNLDNTFGTSTVGASFSIPQPEWINFVGVKLTDPNGSIVWNATSTVSEIDVYNVTTSYYFGSTGVYTLQAYFNQTNNGVEGNINNPVSLSIIINVPSWVFDPVTGDLVPSASTTVATSTLDNFKIECNVDNFILNGMCKLIVAFVIPSAASIQGVQASFANLMTKAPFSFFTQSKTILDAFRVGEASSGGSFSLDIYGGSIPIISTTTAAGIGLGSESIDLLKSIMRVALWLMLAWYLYWRIASIFGV